MHVIYYVISKLEFEMFNYNFRVACLRSFDESKLSAYMLVYIRESEMKELGLGSTIGYEDERWVVS